MKGLVMKRWETVLRGRVYGLAGVEALYQTRSDTIGFESRTVLKMGRKTMIVAQRLVLWADPYSQDDDPVFQAYRQLDSGWFFKLRYDQAVAVRLNCQAV